jgi:hypothetical protein
MKVSSREGKGRQWGPFATSRNFEEVKKALTWIEPREVSKVSSREGKGLQWGPFATSRNFLL